MANFCVKGDGDEKNCKYIIDYDNGNYGIAYCVCTAK